jgi:hypothetical protein
LVETVIATRSSTGPAQPGFRLTKRRLASALSAVNSIVCWLQRKSVTVPTVVTENRFEALPTFTNRSVLGGGASGLAAIKNDNRYVRPAVRPPMV